MSVKNTDHKDWVNNGKTIEELIKWSAPHFTGQVG